MSKTTKSEIVEAKRDYREAIVRHYGKPKVTQAEGAAINRLKARVYMLLEAKRLGV